MEVAARLKLLVKVTTRASLAVPATQRKSVLGVEHVSTKKFGRYPIEVRSADDDFDRLVMEKWRAYLQTLSPSAARSVGKGLSHWKRWYSNLDLAELDDAYAVEDTKGRHDPSVISDESDDDCPDDLADSHDEENIPNVQDCVLPPKQREHREL